MGGGNELEDGYNLQDYGIQKDYTIHLVRIIKPEIIEGINSVWQQGSTNGLSFTSNAEYEDFIKVQIDGEDIETENYDVREGSTIVTLKDSYLETLSAGEHTISIVSESGSAETKFTVNEASDDTKEPIIDDTKTPASDDMKAPKTGDGSNIMLWIVLMLASFVGLIAVIREKEKRCNQK